MAPITYYYLFSIIALLCIGTWLINLIYMRIKSRTIIGRSYKAGTAVYERVMKVASIRNIFITTAITLFALANLLLSVVTVLQVNTEDARLLLVAAPVISLIIWVGIMVKARKDYGTNQSGKNVNSKKSPERGKDDDSWLS